MREHASFCRPKRFLTDPPPFDRLWWHSARCETPEEIAEYSEQQLEKGFYFSSGPSYSKAIVELIWGPRK